jgi:hypothetical protein
MKKNMIGLILCILFLTTIIPINTSAFDENINDGQRSIDICFVFLFGRISDAQQNHDFLSIKAKTVFILDVIFHGIKYFDIQFEIVRGMTRGFIGLEFHGILTENFIFGYLV